MPTQFTAEANYCGRTITIHADTFAELHQALAGVDELNRSARYLVEEKGVKPNHLILLYTEDDDGNSYFKVGDKTSRKSVTFGQKRDKDALIPLFPKTDEGYWDGSQQQSSARPPQHQDRQYEEQGRQDQGREQYPSDDMPF